MKLKCKCGEELVGKIITLPDVIEGMAIEISPCVACTIQAKLRGFHNAMDGMGKTTDDVEEERK